MDGTDGNVGGDGIWFVISRSPARRPAGTPGGTCSRAVCPGEARLERFGPGEWEFTQVLGKPQRSGHVPPLVSVPPAMKVQSIRLYVSGERFAPGRGRRARQSCPQS